MARMLQIEHLGCCGLVFRVEIVDNGICNGIVATHKGRIVDGFWYDMRNVGFDSKGAPMIRI